MYTWKINKWTSDLIISADTPLNEDFKNDILDKLNYLEKIYRDKPKGKIPQDDLKLIDTKYYQYAYNGIGGDYTCMLKGAAIDYIAYYLSNGLRSNSYVVSFGGDIYCRNSKVRVKVDNSNFNILLDGTYSVFTSGNTEKRGNHIIGTDTLYQNTVIVKWMYLKESPSNTLIDILATKIVAREDDMILPIHCELKHKGNMLLYFPINKDGQLDFDAYIASPFFNPEQIKIRDKMASKIAVPFRPDLTDSSKKYDENPSGKGNVEAVVEDNIKGIRISNFLVYPMRTTDLGTLFEVGTALGLDKTIIKYDEVLDEYYVLPFLECYTKYLPILKMVFDCSKKSDVICMGYTAAQSEDQVPLYYQLNGCKDNIMLSVKYHHIELEGNKFIEYERDRSEKDQ